jgi:hypothetical protein
MLFISVVILGEGIRACIRYFLNSLEAGSTSFTESLLGFKNYKTLVSPEEYRKAVKAERVKSVRISCILCLVGLNVMLIGWFNERGWLALSLVTLMVCVAWAWVVRLRRAIFALHFTHEVVEAAATRVTGVWDTTNPGDPYLVIQHKGEVVHVRTPNILTSILSPMSMSSNILANQFNVRIQEALVPSSIMTKLGKWPDGHVLLRSASAMGVGFVAVTELGEEKRSCLWTAAHVLKDQDGRWNEDLLTIEFRGKDITIKVTDEMVVMEGVSRSNGLDFICLNIPLCVFSTLGVRSLKFGLNVSTLPKIVRVCGPVDGVFHESTGRLTFDDMMPLGVIHKASTVPAWSGSPIIHQGLVHGIHLGTGGNGMNYGVCIAPLLNRTRRKQESDTIADNYLRELSDADIIRESSYFSKFQEDKATEMDLEYHSRTSYKSERQAYQIHRGPQHEGKPRGFAISGAGRRVPSVIIDEINARISDDLITEEQGLEILDIADEGMRRGAGGAVVADQVEILLDEKEDVNMVDMATNEVKPTTFRTMEDKARWMVIQSTKPAFRSLDVYQQWADAVTPDHPRVVTLLKQLMEDPDQWHDVKELPAPVREQEARRSKALSEMLKTMRSQKHEVLHEPLTERVTKVKSKKKEIKKRGPVPQESKLQEKLEPVSPEQSPVEPSEAVEDKRLPAQNQENLRGVGETPVKSPSDLKPLNGPESPELTRLVKRVELSALGWSLLQLEIQRQKLLKPNQRNLPKDLEILKYCWLTKRQVQHIEKNLDGIPEWLEKLSDGTGLVGTRQQS